MKRPTLKLTTLLLIGALCAPAIARAEDGNGVGGGGNSFGSQFLDGVLRKSKFDPRQDPNFAKVAKPALEYVRQNLPFLADDMEAMLSKDWYLVDRKIAQNTSKDVVFDADQMAYQDRHAIYIDKSLFDPASGEDKGEMFVHEMLQGIRVAKQLRHPELKDEVGGTSVVLFTNAIMDRAAKTPIDMQDLGVKYLKTAYATKEQAEAGLGTEDNFSQRYLETRMRMDEPYENKAVETCAEKGCPNTAALDQARRLEQEAAYYGQKKSGAPSILNVPRTREALEADMEARMRAKLFGHAHPGFFGDEFRVAENQELCARLKPLAERRNAILLKDRIAAEKARQEQLKKMKQQASENRVSTELYAGKVGSRDIFGRFFSSNYLLRDRAVAIAAASTQSREGNLCLRHLKDQLETLRKDPEVKSICSALTSTCELGAGLIKLYGDYDQGRFRLQYVLWDTAHPEEGAATIVKDPMGGTQAKLMETGKCEIDREEYLAFLKDTVAKRVLVQKQDLEKKDAEALAACTAEYANLQAELAKAAGDVKTLVPTSWLSSVEKKILAESTTDKIFTALAECNSAKAAAQEEASRMKQVASDVREGKRNGPAAANEEAATTAAEFDAK